MAKQNQSKQNRFSRLLAITALAGPLAISSIAAAQPPPYGYPQAQPNQAGYYPDWDRGQTYRSPADQAIRHLERIASYESRWASGHERERLDHAMRHLSEFEERYERGHFDRGRLDDAIADVQHVVDHNPLDSNARRVLVDDLARLRAFRRG
jgi:hypothetical protein